MSTGFLHRLAERSLGLARPVRSSSAPRESVSGPASDPQPEPRTPVVSQVIEPPAAEPAKRPPVAGAAEAVHATTTYQPSPFHKEPTTRTQPRDERHSESGIPQWRHDAGPSLERTGEGTKAPAPKPLLPVQRAPWTFRAPATPRDDARQQTEAAADAPNEVHVSIGRVELIAAPSRPAPVKRTAAAKGGRSLEEYLRPREKGRA